MYYTGYGIGFSVNGTSMVEIDSQDGLLLQTNNGEINVAREIQENHDKINHLMNENRFLTNVLRDLESRLASLEPTDLRVSHFV